MPFLGMGAHLVFVHNRELEPCVAFGTLPAGPDKVCGRLIGFHFGAGAIDQKCGQESRQKATVTAMKHRAEGHGYPGEVEVDVGLEQGPADPFERSAERWLWEETSDSSVARTNENGRPLWSAVNCHQILAEERNPWATCRTWPGRRRERAWRLPAPSASRWSAHRGRSG
jgi:hypothetical protein